MKPIRKRVLLAAFYCSPYRGGESLVGWQVATGLARFHDVTVVCGDLGADAGTADDLERFKRTEGLPPGLEIVHVQAVGLARIIHDLHRIPGLWFLFYEAYRRWQTQVLKLARQMHARCPFDLVHQVNIIGFREPGYLWQLAIPFFWGPVSGAPLIPSVFMKDFGLKERFRWGSRNFLNRIQIRLMKRAAKAAQVAAKVWAVSAEDCAMLASWGVRADSMLEAGCTLADLSETKHRQGDEALRLCWSGWFQGVKALPLLLRAMATSDIHGIQLDVLGDGPEAGRWKALASNLGLDGRIRWHGMLPRDRALAVMQQCHVLVHTSVKEATATVILEALSRGLPVICHNACGMGIAVTNLCGIKVALRDPETSISGFRDAINHLRAEPALIETLSQGALARAEELTWDDKINRFCQAYSEVLHS